MRQLHTGAYVSLLTPGETDCMYRLPSKKDYHVYITRLCPTVHHGRYDGVTWTGPLRAPDETAKR